ncbi:MAG: hypothetical protein HKN43_05735 [Rhodothermales bacterium]|nr:hypothetical protein [Rhodothermales bacterium]
MKLFKGLTGLLVVIMLAGCATTEKRFKKGVEAEERGDYFEAADYFIRVLQKAPDYQPAIDHLGSSGAAAIDQGMQTALDDERRGSFAAAADMMDRMESLAVRSGNVGVVLDLPDDFQAIRDSMEEQAFLQLIDQAETAAVEGRWNDAINEYERALDRTTDTERQARIEEAIGGVHLRWAESFLELERYRDAFARAEFTIERLGPGHPLSQQAMALQDQALIDGTRAIAFLPLGQTENMRRFAPGPFLDDINDVLLYDSWSAPPPFVGAIDNVELRRELRRIVGRGSAVISRGDALEVGRALGADMVFSGELVDYSVDERKVKLKTRKVKTQGRNPVDTTFTVKNFTMYFDTAVEMRIYDARNRNVLYEGRIESSVSRKVERGEYDGDYRDLDLSSKQRDYFDSDEHERQDQELEEQLADDIARKIAERAFDQLLRHID